MRLSTRSEYGLRAMVALAQKPGSAPVPLRVLAEDEGISEQYLEQIFVELRRAGFVLSVRGAKGGYRLARPAQEIGVGDMVRVLEGSLAPMDCLGDSPEYNCAKIPHCMTRRVWERLQSSIEGALDGLSLAEAAGLELASSAR